MPSMTDVEWGAEYDLARAEFNKMPYAKEALKTVKDVIRDREARKGREQMFKKMSVTEMIERKYELFGDTLTFRRVKG